MYELQPVINAVFAGILYSLVWYVNKVLDPTKPTKWTDIDPTAIIATAITGAVIGIASIMYGQVLTQVSIEAQLLSYAALTAFVERILKTIYRIVKSKHPEWFE